MKIAPGRSTRSAATGISLVTFGMLVLWALSSLQALGQSRASGETTDSERYPVLVTAETRANRQTLADLETPGKVIFSDGFESSASLKNYFEIRGLKDGRAKLIADAGVAHSDSGAIQFTAPAREGKSSGAGASFWFGPNGYDQIYFRRYIKFAADYDQGNLNHVGGGMAGVAGTNKWGGMGKAGVRQTGRG